MKKLKACTFIICLFAFMSPALAQQRLNLDDLAIKGELHDDNRIRLIAREHNDLRNFVKFRTHYRSEIIEGLPGNEKPNYQYKTK
jgi:hypothetical protein